MSSAPPPSPPPGFSDPFECAGASHVVEDSSNSACCVVLYLGTAGAQCEPVPIWDITNSFGNPDGDLADVFYGLTTPQLCGYVRTGFAPRFDNHPELGSPEDATKSSLGSTSNNGAIRVGTYIHPTCPSWVASPPPLPDPPPPPNVVPATSTASPPPLDDASSSPVADSDQAKVATASPPPLPPPPPPETATEKSSRLRSFAITFVTFIAIFSCLACLFWRWHKRRHGHASDHEFFARSASVIEEKVSATRKVRRTPSVVAAARANEAVPSCRESVPTATPSCGVVPSTGAVNLCTGAVNLCTSSSASLDGEEEDGGDDEELGRRDEELAREELAREERIRAAAARAGETHVEAGYGDAFGGVGGDGDEAEGGEADGGRERVRGRPSVLAAARAHDVTTANAPAGGGSDSP